MGKEMGFQDTVGCLKSPKVATEKHRWSWIGGQLRHSPGMIIRVEGMILRILSLQQTIIYYWQKKVQRFSLIKVLILERIGLILVYESLSIRQARLGFSHGFWAWMNNEFKNVINKYQKSDMKRTCLKILKSPKRDTFNKNSMSYLKICLLPP